MIVNGYAFAKIGSNVRVVNMRTGKAIVFGNGNEMIETSMDDMDAALALKYLQENAQFMGIIAADEISQHIAPVQ